VFNLPYVKKKGGPANTFGEGYTKGRKIKGLFFNSFES
jgi:hypothetical protein